MKHPLLQFVCLFWWMFFVHPSTLVFILRHEICKKLRPLLLLLFSLVSQSELKTGNQKFWQIASGTCNYIHTYTKYITSKWFTWSMCKLNAENEIKLFHRLLLTLMVQGVLCLRCFLRLWKNNRVSRKPCKRRSDLLLNGQMRVPK